MSDYDAFPEQRQTLIQKILEESGRVVGADVARQLGVSEHTIRRDLQELARRGICKKVYGGAVSQFKQSASFDIRISQNIQEKSGVAQYCADLIRPGTCIFIDAGSTYLSMAGFIPPQMELTVVTNSPQIAAALSGRTQGELILLGGKVYPQTGSVLGTGPINQVRDMLFDQVFIGVCGLDPEAGLTAVYYEDACFKKEVLSQANEVVAAVIADKMPQIARYKVAPCEAIDIVVVSSLTNTESFSRTDVQLRVAE
ncbi:DeoR/GlpR transcriptional regulator (plasmid) [Kosakonia sp. SMBL-WEM22]|uniref:DeoR/GlpR family DNA-binding transcription regulator n=1 Tax=Kosakonia sp. SMBL-WEM22 TaxID=2725560 RepID=UPI001658FB13|nr:DeoR/GlpR family DNA-binding transcription regulator [Kosakonia sp. SMBL-WEM22]QNQ23013.1 DeoR/GlpR transcriptional regulator [Kosakonia sp. SMBL-WEM22]